MFSVEIQEHLLVRVITWSGLVSVRGVKACEAPTVPGVSTAVTGREGLRAGGAAPPGRGDPGSPPRAHFPPHPCSATKSLQRCGERRAGRAAEGGGSGGAVTAPSPPRAQWRRGPASAGPARPGPAVCAALPPWGYCWAGGRPGATASSSSPPPPAHRGPGSSGLGEGCPPAPPMA